MEPSPTRYIEVQGKRIEVDEEGNLKCTEDWCEELAICLSKEDGIELSRNHWEVIKFCRWYYLTYQNCPHPKFIVKNLNKGRESDKYTDKYTVKYLYELFREQPVMKACKYAGIPFTAGCT